MVSYMNRNALPSTSEELVLKLKEISYSIRRYYVDDFYTRRIKCFTENMHVLDIGGKKKSKRGYFDIEKYSLCVKYANISEETKPDFLCDAAAIPVDNSSFDGVICSEVLEHVPDPRQVMREIFRILKPGGRALVVVPFMYHIHADPFDYGRYTDYYWLKLAEETGFTKTEIERQGTIYGVFANLLKLWAMEQLRMKGNGIIKTKIISFIVPRGVGVLMKKDKKAKDMVSSSLYRANTTGFGMVFEK